MGEAWVVKPSVRVSASVRSGRSAPLFDATYLSCTTNASLRQSLLVVQPAEPLLEPSAPCQSELKMKNLPSCETLPIAYAASKNGDSPVLKWWPKRQTFPLPSVAMPRISLYQALGNTLTLLSVASKTGVVSVALALFHD